MTDTCHSLVPPSLPSLAVHLIKDGPEKILVSPFRLSPKRHYSIDWHLRQGIILCDLNPRCSEK